MIRSALAVAGLYAMAAVVAAVLLIVILTWPSSPANFRPVGTCGGEP